MVCSIHGFEGHVWATQGPTLFKIDPEKKEIVAKSDIRLTKLGSIETPRCLIGICESTKEIVLVEPDNLSILRRYKFPKKPSSWAVNKNNLVISDKFGDIFHVDLSKEPQTSSEHTDFENLKPIIGHVSMTLDVAINDGYVFSSDRDEHIRVSCFPDCYVIDKYLLGSTAYISHLLLDGNHLISAGGDNKLTLWDWKTGNICSSVDFRDILKEAPETIEVMAITKSANEVYASIEGVSQVFKFSYPDLNLVQALPCEDTVNDITLLNGVCWAAGGSKIYEQSSGSALNLGSEPDNLTQKHLRKTLSYLRR